MTSKDNFRQVVFISDRHKNDESHPKTIIFKFNPKIIKPVTFRAKRCGDSVYEYRGFEIKKDIYINQAYWDVYNPDGSLNHDLSTTSLKWAKQLIDDYLADNHVSPY